MTIHKASASNYDKVHTESIVDYIQRYTMQIQDDINNGTCGNGKQLSDCDRTQLKAIAAELETVKKRLNYILYGKY